MTYWDTSALFKLYVTEPGSDELFQIAAETKKPVVSSAIITAEMLCALHRKEADGDLGAGSAKVLYSQFLEDIRGNRLLVLPFDSAVAAEAERVVRLAYERRPKIPLRSLDAIHLATALSVRTTVFVTADGRLRDLAALAGMEVLPERPY
jgi:hypothetical protein